ncbi:LON peptidase substrate-binding domain-containing protein [Intrasporangium sp.]|uniref:LON peptidase substrate-binding domain-containing protein n=1 Tax=Intrasporangium sp. TaxID=1925024 RepID=UPI002939F748|nr:LON peptidase substrate-binding domain-containing protein [Intrasporangium sp.]MDV3220680.1 LON peptidase substrate-binding domain-containing protein [Intrasporangium sp.]
MASLPLFPLGTVLLPGTRLPLHVFEPRYVAMLRDLIDAQEERPPVFGVIAIREGNEVGDGAVRALHDVGCGARLTHVAVLGEQRFFVIAEATDRFRLEEVDSLAATPYTTARVTWLDERDGDVTALASLADRLRAELAAFREVTGVEAEDVPEDARGLSYAVPLVVGLDLADRQHLLESPDTESRLRLGLTLTQRERELASALGGALKPPDSPFDLN